MRLGTPEQSGTFRGNYTRSPSRLLMLLEEDDRKAVFGKTERDEGELEIELLATTPALYSTELIS